MSTNADRIEQRIAELLAPAAGLADIQAFYLGMPYFVPQGDWPYVVVVIDTEATVTTYTGNRYVRGYAGALIVNLFHADFPEAVTATIRRVPSYAQMRGYVEAMIAALRDEAAKNLGGLVLPNGSVRRIEVAVEDVQYGLAAETERTDSYINFGVVPFVVETLEAF